MRHGEVDNPAGVLYGRLDGYPLSERGRQMARRAARFLGELGRPVHAVYVSPLERTRQSAAPIEAVTGRRALIDERLVEPYNDFEGSRMRGPGGALAKPGNWWRLRNPWRPSWGEPFAEIAGRMTAALAEAQRSADAAGAPGDLIFVSHQLPIWLLHRQAFGQSFAHHPARRRCALSSVTSFELRDGQLIEVGYAEPAAELEVGAIDRGAI